MAVEVEEAAEVVGTEAEKETREICIVHHPEMSERTLARGAGVTAADRAHEALVAAPRRGEEATVHVVEAQEGVVEVAEEDAGEVPATAATTHAAEAEIDVRSARIHSS